jgi:hypothetical protein
MPKNIALSLAAAGLLALATPSPSYAAEQSKHDCDPNKQAASPSQPKEGPNSGSQNLGSTGWTGGEGTTRMGVTDEGPPGSGHPEIAKGLDPKNDTAKHRPPC